MIEAPTSPVVWEERVEILEFRLGPLGLARVPFRALSLASNPFVVSADLAIPLDDAIATGRRGVVNSAVPVDRNFRTIRLEHGVCRYAIRYGDRYVIDLAGSFSDYLKKFSSESRGKLRRRVKTFARANNGVAHIREYRTPSEIKEFRDIAIAISHASYKKGIGWGFREDETFARQLEIDAAAGSVRGYVLMFDGKPVAYRFCRVDHDVILDKHIGHDEKFTQWSPGTVLLYLIIERLFEQGELRLLDFDGTEYYAYKEFFATRVIRCARVVWFRPTIGNIALFGTHCVVMAAWRLASTIRDSVRDGKRGWLSARRLAGLPGR